MLLEFIAYRWVATIINYRGDLMRKGSRAALISKYVDEALHNLLAYSTNYSMSEPKEGYEKEWNETKAEIELLSDISKMITREENAPAGSEQEHLIKIINSLLSQTASVYIKSNGDNLAAEIFDSVSKKIVLVLEFKHYGCNLHFQSYQLGE